MTLTANQLYDLSSLVRSMHDYEMSMATEVQNDDGAQFDEMSEEDQAKHAQRVGDLLSGMLDELLEAKALIDAAYAMPVLSED